MPSIRLLAALAGAIALAPGALGLSLPSADDEPVPALLDLTGATDRTVSLPLGAPSPTDGGGLGPGTHLLIEREGGLYGCTANFVWRSGSAYYLGAAGHCFMPEDKTATHGAGRDFDASDIRVRACVTACLFGGQTGFLLEGNTVDLGAVAYARQTRDGIDVGNDFGLVRVPTSQQALLRPAFPVFGPAEGVADLRTGDITCHYGNASGFGEVFATKAREGVGILTLPDGSWRAATPSFQGDSGAAVATCALVAGELQASRAVGVLTHLTDAGVAGTTMARAQQLASEAGLAIQPVL